MNMDRVSRSPDGHNQPLPLSPHDAVKNHDDDKSTYDHPNPQRLSPHSFHDNTVNTLLFKDDDVAAALAQSQRTRAVRPILQSLRSMSLCFHFCLFQPQRSCGVKS